MEGGFKKYITLKEASRLCSYSAQYLGLRARQGKLKAVKVGRDWMTTKEWLEEYINQVQEWKQRRNTTNYVSSQTQNQFLPPQKHHSLSSLPSLITKSLLCIMLFVLSFYLFNPLQPNAISFFSHSPNSLPKTSFSLFIIWRQTFIYSFS